VLITDNHIHITAFLHIFKENSATAEPLGDGKAVVALILNS